MKGSQGDGSGIGEIKGLTIPEAARQLRALRELRSTLKKCLLIFRNMDLIFWGLTKIPSLLVTIIYKSKDQEGLMRGD